MSGPSTEQQARAAENQALFRRVNESAERLNEEFDHVTSYGLWACECADSNCLERISLTLAEYEAIREHPNRFAVIPSDAHFFPDVEVVVEKTDRYWVVEKIGEARRVAVELDPRGGPSSAVV